MLTDAEIKRLGLEALTERLGSAEAERFVALIRREPIDYTAWRHNLDEGLSVEEISQRASTLKKSN